MMRWERQIRLTKLFEHFIALVQYEVFHVFRVEDLVSGKGVQTTGGGDDDMGAFGFVAEDLSIFGDWCATIEGVNAYIWHVLGETRVFILDLERKLPSVAKDQNGHFTIHWLKLLQSSKDENSGLSMSRLRLTQHVHSQNSLGNTFLLDYPEIVISLKRVGRT